jgi:hypothetical protein
MSGPFDRDWNQRRQWSDQRLWLQIVFVGVIIMMAIVIVYGASARSLAVAALLTALIYALTRILLRR